MLWMPKTRYCQALRAALTALLLCNNLRAIPLPPTGAILAGPQQQKQEEPNAPKSKKASPPADSGLSVSDQVIQDVLEPLRVGMETQNVSQVLSVFDKRELAGYRNLPGQLRAFFQQYDEVRFRYQILQAAADSGHGSATAEIDMDALPYQAAQVPARRSVQMRFQLKLEPEGWKVLSFTPADFFAVDLNPAALIQP